MDGGSLPNRSEVHYAEGQFVEGVTASCETALETLILESRFVLMTLTVIVGE